MKRKPDWPLILLVLFLIIPFVLRTVKGSLEPYPSALMPAGAKTVRTNVAGLTFSQVQLYGVDSLSGKEKALDHIAFLAPMPVHYLGAVIKYDFGYKNISEPSSELRFFWQTRLKNQGCDAHKIVVRRLERNVPSGVENVTSKHEVIIR